MKAPESPDEFNKLKVIEQAREEEASREMAEEARAKMPKELPSNAEVFARWNEFKMRNNL